MDNMQFTQIKIFKPFTMSKNHLDGHWSLLQMCMNESRREQSDAARAKASNWLE